MADSRLFYAVTLLSCIGAVMSYSLAAYITSHNGYTHFHFFIRQIIAVICGILLMWGLSKLDVEAHFKRIGVAIFLLSIILMVGMHFLPQSFVSSAGGAKRWIRLSFISLAPSELFKIGFVYFLAWSFSRKFVSNVQLSIKDEIRIFIPYLLLFIVAVVLIAVLQNDLGQVILLALTLGVMLLFAGGSLRLLGIIFLGTISTAFLAIITSPHRILRVKSWWASAQDSVLALLPQGWAENLRVSGLPEPYQIYHATNAMSNGGFFGSGLAEGSIKLGFLSDVHTDIILAGITEELGFLGLFGIMLLFGGEEIAQNFIPLLIALWLILKGILWLIHAWRLSKISNLASGVMIMGGLYVLLGVLFVIFPEVLATLISLILGITLIISGGIGLIFWNSLRKMQ